VVRHAQAKQVLATIRFTATELRVGIHDDGVGITPEIAESGRAGHYGLRSMRERAQRIGGRLEIGIGKGAGTSLVLIVPARSAYLQHSLSTTSWMNWPSAARRRQQRKDA
jgi:signal transduction histidine kinase